MSCYRVIRDISIVDYLRFITAFCNFAAWSHMSKEMEETFAKSRTSPVLSCFCARWFDIVTSKIQSKLSHEVLTRECCS